MFTYLFPSSVPYDYTKLGAKSYDNCDFTWANISKNIDIWMVIHFFGWFLLSFICRDFWVLVIWQFEDEMVEMAYKKYLGVFCVKEFCFLILGMLVGLFDPRCFSLQFNGHFLGHDCVKSAEDRRTRLFGTL